MCLPKSFWSVLQLSYNSQQQLLTTFKFIKNHSFTVSSKILFDIMMREMSIYFFLFKTFFALTISFNIKIIIKRLPTGNIFLIYWFILLFPCWLLKPETTGVDCGKEDSKRNAKKYNSILVLNLTDFTKECCPWGLLCN